MAKLTAQEARAIRDSLSKFANDIRDNISMDNISIEEGFEFFKELNKLRNYFSLFTAVSIEATGHELRTTLDKINEATKEANNAVKKIRNIKKAIKVTSALVGLGAAIFAGNPVSILNAAGGVLSAIRT